MHNMSILCTRGHEELLKTFHLFSAYFDTWKGFLSGQLLLSTKCWLILTDPVNGLCALLFKPILIVVKLMLKSRKICYISYESHLNYQLFIICLFFLFLYKVIFKLMIFTNIPISYFLAQRRRWENGRESQFKTQKCPESCSQRKPNKKVVFLLFSLVILRFVYISFLLIFYFVFSAYIL